MKDWLEPKRYLNEVLTPKQDSEDIEGDLAKFTEKYNASLAHDFVICITDNPVGMLSFEALDTIDTTGVETKPERLLIHLNTFHRKVDLDRMLRAMAERGLKYLLVVSGDGNDRLHRLEPAELGITGVQTITSVELMTYINREYPGQFVHGVAFNHYEPQHSEREKLKRKLDAGAAFVITQPVIRRNDNVDWLKCLTLPVFVEAWMTKRIDLVANCVGYELPPEDLNYDPLVNLRALRSAYPTFGVYAAFLGMKKQVNEVLAL